MAIDVYGELVALTKRAKAARNAFPSLKGLDTLPALTMAEELGRLGGDFIKLSVQFKQAARAEADQHVKNRPEWTGPKMTAQRAAAALRKRGAYSL